MTSLWFIVPAHGRHRLARICLTQLRRTCDLLEREGIEATAVVIADDENLDTARDLGFGTVERDNRFVSRKFNDGIQLAFDPAVNPRPVDYVVPVGSDDWVDHRLFTSPNPSAIVCYRSLSFVREDGLELSTGYTRNDGGCGIRIIPRSFVAPLGYRPADENRHRGCDTSMLNNLRAAHGPDLPLEHRPNEPWQIVDWKTPGENLNTYTAVGIWKRGQERSEPFAALMDYWPLNPLNEMLVHYHGSMVAA